MKFPWGSKSTAPSLGPIIELWWFRFILTILTIAGAAIVSVTSFTDRNLVILSVYGILTVSMIGIELMRRRGTVRSSGIGLTKKTVSVITVAGLLAVVMLGIVLIACLLLGGTLSVPTPQLTFIGLTVIIVSSATEEVMFRGTIFQALLERFGPPVAIISTSILFGVAHLMNPGISILAILNVVLAGILLGSLVVRTQSLWAAISFHVVWNGCVYLFIGSVSGHTYQSVISTLESSAIPADLLWLVSGPFGVEQGLLTTVLLACAVPTVFKVMKPDAEIIAARRERNMAVPLQHDVI
jgi:membrane protease YdiL (CAAX protease family)